jgi:hypothetical protein
MKGSLKLGTIKGIGILCIGHSHYHRFISIIVVLWCNTNHGLYCSFFVFCSCVLHELGHSFAKLLLVQNMPS